jgi:hypothetical protein
MTKILAFPYTCSTAHLSEEAATRPLALLDRIVPEIDLRRKRDTAFQLNKRLTLIGYWRPGGFRSDRKGEEVLTSLEALMAHLDGQTPTSASLERELALAFNHRGRACDTRYFRIVLIRGCGDLVVECKRVDLLQQINRWVAVRHCLLPSAPVGESR